jgi:hypothetical protein
MTGAAPVQCPHCGTMMDERARFCPGCGTPRTAVREALERESAATGVPYAQLLERDRTSGSTGPTPSGAAGWGEPQQAAPPPPQDRRRLWIILGIIGGVTLLLCVGCVVVAAILFNRFDVNLGDSPEGDAAREQLELASAGRHEERWELLHPDQQLVVPVGLFATCAQYDDSGSVEIFASVQDNNTFIARVGTVDARVVIYAFSEGTSNETGFVYMVRVDGDWRWTLTDDEIRDYELGICP